MVNDMENNEIKLFFGHLGADPFLAYTAKKLEPICEMSLAVKDEKNETTWKKIVAFGKLAELCKVHLKKGNEVFVRGRIRLNKYKNKEGEVKESFDVLVHSVAQSLF